MPNPHAGVPGARMYRTGDLGRWRQDRNLEVIGRVDRQVKVRGYRVEPAEIEGVLATHPDIGQAAVTMHDLGGGDKHIAAYYTLPPGRDAPGPPSAGQRSPFRRPAPAFAPKARSAPPCRPGCATCGLRC